jgi:3'-phosphoadenosine 5'-phosphosulfate sulfotransferase (PAPS reductase)/FAD synthetase
MTEVIHRSEKPRRVICRFSCGAASAVATKLALAKYGEVEINYSDTGSEHSDNARFIKDCEKWFDQPITITRSEKYSDTWAVFEARRYLVGHAGAPCTGELKRIPGDSIWNPGDIEIYGFTVEEQKRVDRWRKHNPERIIETPLIEKGLTKQDCFGILDRAKIELPAMYFLGFRNNNCIACVKARDSIDYWKRTRKHFPEQFYRMAKLERELNHTINRVNVDGEKTPIYLDEIEAGEPKGADPDIQCGIFCMAAEDAL